jgi:hypothetical protein
MVPNYGEVAEGKSEVRIQIIINILRIYRGK